MAWLGWKFTFPKQLIMVETPKIKNDVIANCAIITEARSVQYVKWYMKILRIIAVYKNCIYSEVWPPNHEFV